MDYFIQKEEFIVSPLEHKHLFLKTLKNFSYISGITISNILDKCFLSISVNGKKIVNRVSFAFFDISSLGTPFEKIFTPVFADAQGSIVDIEIENRDNEIFKGDIFFLLNNKKSSDVLYFQKQIILPDAAVFVSEDIDIFDSWQLTYLTILPVKDAKGSLSLKKNTQILLNDIPFELFNYNLYKRSLPLMIEKNLNITIKGDSGNEQILIFKIEKKDE